ncbi:PH domain-containing protein [Phaeobacter piscinae]|uniref:PH domain-containing protein n=1 Tax=Phaeobacter piscinae TaxID=1580596 RepID=UPI00058B227C|nr:PH domain-containing protein [Phaeobacter piscinae]UTS82748.1 hypothetical protein OL67_003858 [Phaeobacter piscinae]
MSAEKNASEVLYVSRPVMFRDKPFRFAFYLITTPILIGIIGFGVWYLACLANRLTVTKHQMTREVGILSKERTEVALESIRSVNVKQSLMNRIFDTGQVSISTIGDNPEIVLSGLPRPNEIRTIVNDSRDNHAVAGTA